MPTEPAQGRHGDGALIWFLANSKVDRLTELASTGVQCAVQAVSSAAGVLWIFDGSKLHLFATYDFPYALFSGRTISIGQGLSGQAILERRAFTSGSLADDDRVALRETGFTMMYRSCAAIPIIVKNRPFGVINIFDTKCRQFRRHELNLVNLLGVKLALSLHHCTLFPDFISDWMTLIRFDIGTVRQDKVSMDAIDPHPKGIQKPTLDAIYFALKNQKESVTGKQLALLTGLSQTTLRHYLIYMTREGLIHRSPSYGKPGRPVYRYWVTFLSDSSELQGSHGLD